MIDKIFFGILGSFSSIIAFIIVALMVGGILLFPLILKGGWCIYILYIAYIIMIDDYNKKNEKKK